MILQTERMIYMLLVRVWLCCTLVYLQCCTLRVQHAMLHSQSSTVDHGQHHVIMLQPISKAARSWLYDNMTREFCYVSKISSD